MHISITLLSLASVALGASPAQLYLSPVSLSAGPTPSLTAPQANAVIAHHLGVSQYESAPVTNRYDTEWEKALGSQWSGSSGKKVVVVLECAGDCSALIPDQFATVQPFSVPNLPEHSWSSLVSLHLHRLASSLGYSATDKDAFPGLDALVTSLKQVAGWAGWVGEELGARMGWQQLAQSVKDKAQPVRGALVGDLDLLDKSAASLIDELHSLVALVDSHASASAEAIVIRLSGLNEVAAAHRPGSAEFTRAASLLKSTLSATLASLDSTSSAQEHKPTVVLLALPPYKQPLLRKRTQWLAPFAGARAKFARSGPSVNLAKRGTAEEGRVDKAVLLKRQAAQAAKRVPVVPISKTCFSTEADLINQTASCLGRGMGVQGLTTRGSTCWVCQCAPTVNAQGQTTKWAGEGCEKIDLSADATLLFFSGAGLILVLAFSVGVLYKVGQVELPGTLSSVGGSGGVKKD